MIAQKLGPTAFAQELTKFGLGKKTGIELPGESAGSYPVQSQWSATSFANLPIGQGISMTMLQLVDMYQAIGNKGVMVSPTIIAGTTKSGVYTPAKARSTRPVMKPTTAATLLGHVARHGAGRRLVPPRHRSEGGHHRLPGGRQDRHGTADQSGDACLFADRDHRDLRRHRSGRQPQVRHRHHDRRAGRLGRRAATAPRRCSTRSRPTRCGPRTCRLRPPRRRSTTCTSSEPGSLHPRVHLTAAQLSRVAPELCRRRPARPTRQRRRASVRRR